MSFGELNDNMIKELIFLFDISLLQNSFCRRAKRPFQGGQPNRLGAIVMVNGGVYGGRQTTALVNSITEAVGLRQALPVNMH